MSSKLRNLVASFLIVILICSVGIIYLIKTQGSLEPSEMEAGQEEWIREKDRINILLLGTDEDFMTKSRTDTIILASLDMKQHQISFLSIPRDTRVKIPGYGENKLNAANFLGGVDLVKESISQLIKVPIDYYVLTNFNGFVDIIDTIGGVELNVEQNMKYHTYDGMIDLKKGVQRLNGDKALQYVRFRHDKLGDITRTQRQQKFLSALAKEMMQSKNIVKLPQLIPQLNKAVKTDLSISQMIALGKDLNEFASGSINSQTLPGNFMDINGASYWYVDESKAQQVVLEVFAGKSGSEVIDTESTVLAAEKSKPQKQVLSVTQQRRKNDVNKNADQKKKDNSQMVEDKKVVPDNQNVEIEVIREEKSIPGNDYPQGKIEILPSDLEKEGVSESEKNKVVDEKVAPVENMSSDPSTEDQSKVDLPLQATPDTEMPPSDETNICEE